VLVGLVLESDHALAVVYTHAQRLSSHSTHRLRFKAGRWLRELRNEHGLSQRELARLVGVREAAFISQLENGKGRIPPDRYLIWADALGVEPREFARKLMSYYDPVTYDIIFGRLTRRQRFK
jgi:transcriptional regulator with XRE-family HTH domain